MILADTETEGSKCLRMREGAPTDLELIAAANRGDCSAFEDLYRRHRDWVARVAFRFTRDEDLALDAAQEVFLYFLKKFPGFQLRCELRTFLYPAARNTAISMRRKSDRLVADEEIVAAATATESVGGETDLLAVVMQNLPEQQREVLMLRFVDGMALGEIATALEIPLGTVKSRLHNALATLEKDPLAKGFLTE